MYFSEHENHSQMDHNILFCGKKKQMSTIALKDNDHHLATEIFVHMTSPHPHCPFDILSAISSHYYSFPFLPSPLFTSIPLPSLLPLYPGGRDQQHGALSAFPCCASITSLKPPTTRIMPPMLPASLCLCDHVFSIHLCPDFIFQLFTLSGRLCCAHTV